MILAWVNCKGVTWRSAMAAAMTYGSEWSAVSLVCGSYLLGSLRMSAPRAVVRMCTFAMSLGLRSWSFTSASTAEIRSEEHTSELQSLRHLVCRLLLEKK